MKKLAHAQRGRRIYWPNCAVCQYMKKHPDFRTRIMKSTYFEEKGTENLLEVVHAYGDPFKPSAMYQHVKRHQAKDLIRAESQYAKRTAPPIVEVVEGQVASTATHERGLDEFITAGRNKLAAGELPITATSYLQAIKIKSDIEKNTKDRRMEMIKSFFGGQNGQTEDGSAGEQPSAS